MSVVTEAVGSQRNSIKQGVVASLALITRNINIQKQK